MGGPVKRIALLSALAAALSTAGCKSIATRTAADALAASGDTYARDDDPELVRAAVPFGLKTMEGVLQSEPKHVGLLTSLASGFTSYAYAFVVADAQTDDLQDRVEAAQAARREAKKLLVRARDYGLRGLDARHAGLAAALRGMRDLDRALAVTRKDDVPLLYWTASAWALAISNAKDDMSLVAELPAPIAMMRRALGLDEAWGAGALHEFFVTYDATRGGAEGIERAKAHLDRAIALSQGQKLGPLVAWAEGALVARQDRAAFTKVLEEVVRADPEKLAPAYRLANVLAVRRARDLLAHADALFL